MYISMGKTGAIQLYAKCIFSEKTVTFSNITHQYSVKSVKFNSQTHTYSIRIIDVSLTNSNIFSEDQ